MDTGVSAHTLLLVCWPTVALLSAFAVLFFSLRQSTGSVPHRDGSARAQRKGFIGATKFLLLGVILLAAVFLIPDAGQVEHRSFISNL